MDWVTKRLLIERYMAKHDLPLASPRVALLDLAYHDVNRDRGLYYLLEKAGNVERVVHRSRDQPRDARAAADHPREAARRFHPPGQGETRDYTVDWVHLKLNDQAQRTVLCKDPFRSVDERVEQLIAHM